MEWSQANGIAAPRDLQFAFTSRDEAEAEGGKEVAELWVEAVRKPQDLPPTWDLWTRASCKKSNPVARVKTPCSKARVSSRRSGKVRRQSDEADAAERRSAATKVVVVAQGWQDKCRLLQSVGCSKDERSEFWNRTFDKVCQFEASSTMARYRTWLRWSSWCARKRTNPVEPLVAQIQALIEGEGGTGVGQTAPRARWDHLKWWARHMGAPMELPD